MSVKVCYTWSKFRGVSTNNIVAVIFSAKDIMVIMDCHVGSSFVYEYSKISYCDDDVTCQLSRYCHWKQTIVPYCSPFRDINIVIAGSLSFHPRMAQLPQWYCLLIFGALSCYRISDLYIEHCSIQ